MVGGAALATWAQLLPFSRRFIQLEVFGSLVIFFHPTYVLLETPFWWMGLEYPKAYWTCFSSSFQALTEKPRDMPKYPPPQSFYEGGYIILYPTPIPLENQAG